MANLADSVGAVLAGTKKITGGFLVTDAFVARTGIQTYLGKEIGHADENRVFKVYRSLGEVTNPTSVKGFSHTPITMGHPQELVDASNWKKYAIGEVSTEATWQDGKLRMPLIVKDAEAIRDIEAGTRELSPGYVSTIDFTPGITPEGVPYDAKQTNIRINHIAVVPTGRSGSAVRIGDSGHVIGQTWGQPKQPEQPEVLPMLKKIIFDGITIETTEAGIQAIDKLTMQLADAEKKLAAKDTELGEKDSEIERQKKKALPPEAVDKLVEDRAALVGNAKKVIKDFDPAGKDAATIRRTVVQMKLGDAAIKDRADAYVEARFDGLVEDATANHPSNKPDAVRKAMADAGPQVLNDAGSAWDHVLKNTGIVKA